MSLLMFEPILLLGTVFAYKVPSPCAVATCLLMNEEVLSSSLNFNLHIKVTSRVLDEEPRHVIAFWVAFKKAGLESGILGLGADLTGPGVCHFVEVVAVGRSRHERKLVLI